jgi:hypothetical protein
MRLENMEKTWRTKDPGPASLPVEIRKNSVTSIVGKSSKNSKSSSMFCHYCEKKNYSTADYREISSSNNSNALKRELRPLKRL